MYKRVDNNQVKVVSALRKCGFSVAITSMVGKGFPDLVVAKNGKNLLVELKDGEKSESRRQLTADERRFFITWRGEIIIANNLDDILKEFQ